jgi:hypothetical protein
MLVSCLAYSSTLKMEATCSSETLADFQWTTRCYIPDDIILHNHRCEKIQSYDVFVVLLLVLNTFTVLAGCRLLAVGKRSKCLDDYYYCGLFCDAVNISE